MICPKRIYNFFLLHAYFVRYCYDIDELPYTFDHIWTNLLNQCTPVPVPVFCCFSISGFPHIKSAPKIREKSNKKISDQEASGITEGGGAEGTHQGPRRPPGAPQGGAAPGGLLTPGGPPGCPPS